MHDHEGDEIVEIPLPDLAQQGDKVYCTVVIEQFSGKPAFYTVAYDYALTADDIASGERLTFPIARGWLARQKPRYESLTCQAAWITSGLPAQPPAEVGNPNEETRLPRNALEIQHRRTASFIGDQGLEDLQPPRPPADRLAPRGSRAQARHLRRAQAARRPGCGLGSPSAEGLCSSPS